MFDKITDFITAIKSYIRDAVGCGLDHDSSLSIYLAKLYNAENQMLVMYHFPSGSKLRAVAVRGTPPPKDAIVYFSTLKRCDNPEYKFDSPDDRKWIVQRVDYSIVVEPDSQEALRRMVRGKEPNTYKAEVHLKPSFEEEQDD